MQTSTSKERIYHPDIAKKSKPKRLKTNNLRSKRAGFFLAVGFKKRSFANV